MVMVLQHKNGSRVTATFEGDTLWDGAVVLSGGGKARTEAQETLEQVSPTAQVPFHWTNGEEKTAWPLIRDILLQADLTPVKDPGCGEVPPGRRAPLQKGQIG